MCRHGVTTAIVGIAHAESPKNDPVQAKNRDELVDYTDLEIQQPEPQHRRDDVEIRNGSKIRPRITMDCVRRCISTAIAMANMVCSTMLITTYSTVTRIAFQNSGSWKSRVKLSKPMKVGVPSSCTWSD